MQIRNVLFVLGFLATCIALCLFLPIGVSLLYQEYDSALKLGLCLSIGLISGVLCSYIYRPSQNVQLKLTTREGVAVVGLSWVFATIISALPYYFITPVSFAQALFEAASGLSTTGASVYTDVEALPYGLLFWRSLTQWMGGLGIIVFSLALLPFLGAGGMQLYKAEVSGVTKNKIAPRMVDTARSLWGIYIILTLLLWFLLTMQGLSSFDAINHALTTLATGGFSTTNTSLAGFTPLMQWTIIVFMFIAGINFSLHFLFLRQGPKAYRKNEECLYYTLFICAGVALIATFLYFDSTQAQSLLMETPTEYTIERSIRDASMQVVSLITTTGFATVDYLQWPLFLQGLLLLYIFFGGCAGSTAGGIKIMRIVLSFKLIANELNRLAHPHMVERIKMNGASVGSDALKGVASFIILYFVANFLGTMALLICDYDFVTSFSAVATCISNVGPAFGQVGPAFNFGFMNDFALTVLSALMIFGRLELLTLLLLFTPKFWRI